MPTIRLVPSAYSVSSSNRVTVTDASNMYYNTDHTTNYCSIRGRNSTSSTYYAFISGFNFSDVPSDATVSSFSIKIRCYRNQYLSTGSSYRLRLASSASSSSAISDTTLSSDITQTSAVYTFPNGSLNWSTLSGYGSSFCIEVPLRASSSQYPYLYVYGAEIEVTYSLPTPYDITVTNNTTGTITPSGTTQVYAGDSFAMSISGASSPTVTDNNVDVTSQLVQVTGGTTTYIPYDNEYTGFTISNIDNSYSDISGSTYADCSVAGRTTGNLYLDLGPINLPSGASITSVSCQASLQVSRNGSSSSMTASCQMYSGSNAKGSSYSIVSSATDVSRTTYTLTVGSWTASELQNARFYLTMYNGASSTVRHIYVYGVSFTVTYTVSGVIYTYTI